MGLFGRLANAKKTSRSGAEKIAELREGYDSARQIDGKPWWYSNSDAIVISYQDEVQPDRELVFASARGWYIADITAEDGCINLGRTATGAVLTGGISLLFGGSRHKRPVIINWRRDTSS